MPSKADLQVVGDIAELILTGGAATVKAALPMLNPPIPEKRLGEVKRWLASEGISVRELHIQRKQRQLAIAVAEAEKAAKEEGPYIVPDIEAVPEVSGDWLVVNDVHLPTTDYEYALRLPRIADRHLPNCEGLIINGDLANFEAFSAFAPLVGQPTWAQELQSAKWMLAEWLKVFKRVVITLGNHEHRIFKAWGGQLTIEMLLAMITTDPRVEMKMRDRVTAHTDNGDWTIVHGSNYSRNQLWNPNRLAQKFNTHVIAGHEHHWGQGMDDFKRYHVIANGGLFDTSKIAYMQLKTSTMPNMAKGFTMLRRGYGYLFGDDTVTDWGYWLPSKHIVPAIRSKEAAAK